MHETCEPEYLLYTFCRGIFFNSSIANIRAEGDRERKNAEGMKETNVCRTSHVFMISIHISMVEGVSTGREREREECMYA
jgi:hypothetical protein